MGRTGKMFAAEHFDAEPDILALAKGIASGLPLSATIARADIMDWKPGARTPQLSEAIRSVVCGVNGND